jgi:hypothetical protein
MTTLLLLLIVCLWEGGWGRGGAYVIRGGDERRKGLQQQLELVRAAFGRRQVKKSGFSSTRLSLDLSSAPLRCAQYAFEHGSSISLSCCDAQRADAEVVALAGIGAGSQQDVGNVVPAGLKSAYKWRVSIRVAGSVDLNVFDLEQRLHKRKVLRDGLDRAVQRRPPVDDGSVHVLLDTLHAGGDVVRRHIETFAQLLELFFDFFRQADVGHAREFRRHGAEAGG